ncbi:hypothetical protein VNI00_013574 [Paramarasmius palmivorus]|uniref:DUF7918 domain-containing protein n=1 Tax=Paramarasmius palmivorus TaxID=297713 RepID=A0AAW0BW66_9AGAR
MVSFAEFSAWINIEGHKAQEYGVEVSEAEKTVTCWIPSEEGKAFEICWDDSSRFSATTGSVRVDGNLCGREIRLIDQTRCSRRRGIRVSSNMIRPFIFSRVKTTDDDNDVTASSSNTAEVGEISVAIIRTRVLTKSSGKPKTHHIPHSQTFHEKSKKAIDHQTSFGEAVVSTTTKWKSQHYGSTVATFRFKYRPLAMLQANGIASPPSPTRKRPLDVHPDDVIEISDGSGEEQELERLQARVEELEARRSRKRIKAESGVKKEVKREPIIGGFIDLTES